MHGEPSHRRLSRETNKQIQKTGEHYITVENVKQLDYLRSQALQTIEEYQDIKGSMQKFVEEKKDPFIRLNKLIQMCNNLGSYIQESEIFHNALSTNQPHLLDHPYVKEIKQNIEIAKNNYGKIGIESRRIFNENPGITAYYEIGESIVAWTAREVMKTNPFAPPLIDTSQNESSLEEARKSEVSIQTEHEGRIFTPEEGRTRLKKIDQLPSYKDTTLDFENRYHVNEIRAYNPSTDYGPVIDLMDGQESKYTFVKLSVNEMVCYYNWVNLEDGIYIAENNYKNEDREAKAGSPLPNSEIMWHTIRLAAEHKNFPLTNFTFNKIRRFDMGNADTVATVYHYTGKKHEYTPDMEFMENIGHENSTDNIQTFHKDSNPYLGIIMTPNATAVPYILKEHKDTFGHRELKSITVQLGYEKAYGEEIDGIEWDRIYCMDFIIGEK